MLRGNIMATANTNLRSENKEKQKTSKSLKTPFPEHGNKRWCRRRYKKKRLKLHDIPGRYVYRYRIPSARMPMHCFLWVAKNDYLVSLSISQYFRLIKDFKIDHTVPDIIWATGHQFQNCQVVCLRSSVRFQQVSQQFSMSESASANTV